MATQMARPFFRQRSRTGKLRPHFDALETRLAMSGPGDLAPPTFNPDPAPPQTDQGTTDLGQTLSLALLSASPADGATLHETPTSFTVRFNQALSPDSLSFLSDDLLLFQVINGQSQPVDLSLFNPTITLSDDRTSISLSFDASTPSRFTLDTGIYQIAINPLTALMSADGQMLAIDPSAPPIVVSTFAIAPKGMTLADSQTIDLGLGKVTTTKGQLDFIRNPYDVKLYRIDLPQGQTWRLGAEIAARHGGQSLDTSMSLFHADGTIVRFDQAGNLIDLNGTLSKPNPYLFVGLPGGTYYLGISGKGNLGDDPGGTGYSPVHGFAGTVSQNYQSGGEFTLNVVIDAVKSGAVVSKVQIDHADPTRYEPTGLTLEFTGALQFSSTGVLNSGRISGLELLDQSGVSWPINAANYDAGHARLSLVFSRSLPAGQYQLRTLERGGLVDLAGFQPVGQGTDAHLLASFVVEAANNSVSTYYGNTIDVGPFLPADGGVTGRAVVTKDNALSVRIVVTLSKATYQFQTQSDTGAVTLTGTNANGSESNITLQANSLNLILITLTPGIYTFHVHAKDSDAHTIEWGFALKRAGSESLITNVIGQDSNLGARLVSPTSSIDRSNTITAPLPLGGVSSAPLFASPAIPSPGYTAPETHSEGSVIFAAAAVQIGFYPTAANALVGTPTNDAQHLAVVGPTTGSGSTALAYNGSGLMSGIGFGKSMSEDFYTNHGSDGTIREQQLTTGPTSGALPASVTANRQSRSTDDQVLAEISWAERMGNTLNRWRTRLVNVPIDEAGLAIGDDAGASEPVETTVEEGRLQTADLSMPFGIGAVTYLAIRYRRSLTQWLRGPKGTTQLAMPGRPMGQKKRSNLRV